MTASLRPLDRSRLPEWIDRSAAEYARDLVATGRSEEWAARHAVDGMADSFPGGVPMPGHEAMQLAEEHARSQGAHSIGLNVFAFNAAARGLYESLGYETASMRMAKRFD
ncbi:GNAT family N-acetyltransferase [Agromyces sp. NPDC056379]|uniref:GNAT family N-acetyltransferase n=1 Tax=unclassified Agromyces TaxID=2639701 RepID=UPI0035DFCCC7